MTGENSDGKGQDTLVSNFRANNEEGRTKYIKTSSMEYETGLNKL